MSVINILLIQKTVEVLSELRPIVDNDTSKTAKITWFLVVLHWTMDVIYMTSIISTAQWINRRNQVIFAVLDVSLNNGP